MASGSPETLLNWDIAAQKKVRPDRTCIIEKFLMKRGQTTGDHAGWSIAPDDLIAGLMPRPPHGLFKEDPFDRRSPDETKKFMRVVLTFHIPMADQRRKTADAQAPAPQAVREEGK